MEHVTEISTTSNEVDEDDDIITKYVSDSQACEALETLLAYLEQQSDSIPMGTTVLLNALLTQIAKKRFQALRQSKVNDYFEKV